METVYIKKPREATKAKKVLEEKLDLEIKIKGRQFIISGDSLDEYEAEKIFNAINFGFSAHVALQLIRPEVDLRILHIREFTRRKNLKDVKSRLIGTHGKTKNTIEKITDCEVIINANEVGLIGDVESLDNASTAITNIIRGAKQSNAYKYLERLNKSKKDMGLGIKK